MDWRRRRAGARQALFPTWPGDALETS